MADEYITATEAREILRVNKPKMAQLIRDGALVAVESEFDRRVKLIRRVDVERLAQAPRANARVSASA